LQLLFEGAGGLVASGQIGGLIASRLGQRRLAARSFPGHLQLVLRPRQLQLQLADLALPLQPAILGRLQLAAPALELDLGHLRLRPGFGQAPLQGLQLGPGPALDLASFPPFLPDQAAPQQLQAGLGFRRGPGSLRLHPERIQARLDLDAKVLKPEQVGRQLLEPDRGLSALGLDAAHLGRLLDQGPALVGTAADDGFDVALVNDRVGVRGQTGRGQQVEQVPAADAAAVQEVVALAAPVQAPADGDFRIVNGEPAVRVVDHDRDLCHRRPASTFAAGVDDLVHAFAPQVTGLALAQDPFEGIDDVGLA
jgi:hypothetical protein